MEIDNDLIMKVVQLGHAVRRRRSEGVLQSVAPPTLYGYLTMLRMCGALPHLSPQQVALSTLLGSASMEDRKHAMSVLDEVFGPRISLEDVPVIQALSPPDYSGVEDPVQRVSDAVSINDF